MSRFPSAFSGLCPTDVTKIAQIQPGHLRLPKVDDQVILTPPNPITGSRDGPSALPEGNHHLGFVKAVHNPAYGMLPEKHHKNGLAFLHCFLLAITIYSSIKNEN
jgi:hypothetical protein